MIGQPQVDDGHLGAVALGGADRRRGVGHALGFVAAIAERRHQNRPESVVVFDDEDVGNDARHHDLAGSCRIAAVPCPGVERNRSVPPIWSANARTRNRPRPRPAPGGLVVKNGSPRPRRFRRVHAAAAVDDLDAHAVLLRDAQRHALIRRRRVEGVAQQRDQRLPQRLGGGVDRARVGGKRDVEPLASDVAEAIAEVVDQARQRDRRVGGRGRRGAAAQLIEDGACSDRPRRESALMYSRFGGVALAAARPSIVRARRRPC